MPDSERYRSTHPWITFRLDLRRLSGEVWEKLGEASAYCESLTRVPLRPDVAQRLHEVYLAKGVMATTAIEGNTLSEDQVLKVVQQEKLDLPPSQEYQQIEVRNIIDAVNETCKSLLRGDHNLSLELICDYNRRVLKDTILRDDVVPGELREHNVGVGSYRAVPWQDAEPLLSRLVDWLNSGAFEAPDPTRKIAFAVIKAVVAHLYLAWIHPFGDGNGRTARLIEFHILIEAGMPLPAGHLLSNHYNQTRARYYLELEKASKSGGDLVPFVLYAVTGLVEGLEQQLNQVRDEHWSVAWENFVHSEFHGKHGEAADRRKRLVLDISKQPDPVPRSQVPSLSAKLVRAYIEKTDKMVTRDINAVVKMGLIRRTPQGLVPNREKLIAFSPPADRRQLRDESS